MKFMLLYWAFSVIGVHSNSWRDRNDDMDGQMVRVESGCCGYQRGGALV